MIRLRVITNLCLTVSVAVACLTGSASGQDWTAAAFPIKTHDFGTVAVSAKTEFRFPVTNTLSSTMHIQTVRASCGCTTPIIESHYINPGETGTILARFNTDTFRGKKGATLTVVVDQPFYSEARLRVDGYIRSDMVFYPGAIEFGKLSQGEPANKSTKVLYAGRSTWKIVDIQSNRPWLIPTFNETVRESGRVNYEIGVSIREDAPTGFFQDEIVVITDDRSMPRVPLRVSGQIDSALTISPRAMALGSLKPGQSVSQKMILIGKEPFTVASINADGWDVKFAPSIDAKKTHVLFVEFTPNQAVSGPVKSTIEITTSGTQSVTAKSLLTADIRDR
jgi:hypothetical protein